MLRRGLVLIGGALFALSACREPSAFETYAKRVLSNYGDEQIEDCAYVQTLAVERDRSRPGPEGDLKINSSVVRSVFQLFYHQETGKALSLEEIAAQSSLSKHFTLKMMKSGDRDGLSANVMVRLNKCAALINSIVSSRSLRRAYESGALEAVK